MQLGADPEPHVGSDSPGRLAQDAGRARQHILDRVGPGHPVGELRQNLVRRGPLAVDQAVGEPPAPVLIGWKATATMAVARTDRPTLPFEPMIAPIPTTIPT